MRLQREIERARSKNQQQHRRYGSLYTMHGNVKIVYMKRIQIRLFSYFVVVSFLFVELLRSYVANMDNNKYTHYNHFEYMNYIKLCLDFGEYFGPTRKTVSRVKQVNE